MYRFHNPFGSRLMPVTVFKLAVLVFCLLRLPIHTYRTVLDHAQILSGHAAHIPFCGKGFILQLQSQDRTVFNHRIRFVLGCNTAHILVAAQLHPFSAGRAVSSASANSGIRDLSIV